MMIATTIALMLLLGEGTMTILLSPNISAVMMMNEVSEVNEAATTSAVALTPTTPRAAAVAAALHQRKNVESPLPRNF